MKIAIFYHIGQIGVWIPIYQSQVHRLHTSGLLKEASHVHFGVNGEQNLFNVPSKAIVKTNTDWSSEIGTLVSLKNFCEEHLDYKILYFHTKGSSKGNVNGQSWRLMMEYFVIDKWKKCIDYLDEYDCVGPEMNILGPTLWSDGSLTENDPTPFFTGNFWWANASYINTIKGRYIDSNLRLDKEWWIGDGEYGCKSKNLFKSGCGETCPYDYYFHEEEYL